MRLSLPTLALAFIVVSNCGQDTCFDKCLNNFENSTLPFPEKSEIMLQGLIGCKAPNFNVKTITGQNLKSSDLKGKVIVINFWLEACTPCVAEIPALNKLKEDYKTKDVVFIAFGQDDTNSIKDFLKRKEFNYHQVSADYDLLNDFCLVSWPTHMVFDGEGVLRQIFTGGDENQQTEAYDKIRPTIEKYLSGN